MRRADRLFQIIQLLRRSRTSLTADAIALELETSKRTVYRDIATLMAQRVPVRGEAGIGYMLEGGFDLPPLMLTADEIEAAVLGAQWVIARGEPTLARAAQDLVAKIAATVPGPLRSLVLEPSVGTPPSWQSRQEAVDVARLRTWCRNGKKLSLSYQDEHGRTSQRKIWPFLLGYRETSRMLVAWCEMRQDFRMFRTDRVRDVCYLAERYPARPATLQAKWRAKRMSEMAALRPDNSPVRLPPT